ncbi:MAG: leucyl aminopeptidase family protein [Phycisphaerales bacterium]|nr:MAG: leucyl aminopeptidase family protein [Phycisphaerales bacterium]
MFQSVRVSTTASRARPSTLVLAVFQPTRDGASPTLDPAAARFDNDGAIAAALKRPDATGECARVTEAFPAGQRVLLLGLGKPGDCTDDTLRAALAALGKKLAEIKAADAAIEIADTLAGAKNPVAPDRAGLLFGEAMGLLSFVYDPLKGSAGTRTARKDITLRASSKRFTDAMKQGLALATSANLSRWWSSTPPNIATPMWMALQAKVVAQKTGMRCDVYEGRALEEHRLHGIRIVGDASVHKPCMVRLEYRPRGPRSNARPIVLVGKTLTYDTGGLSLKINNSMRGMKGDKDGGCAVLAAMHAIATVIKPSRPVVALLACAENSVADNAYRPDDVIAFRNGVTVEVTNTDAEGRLVLADALCWACEEENASHVIDVATLTGGVVVALGSTYAGLWCDDDALRAKLERAADTTGERLWRLPLHQEYRDMMRSGVADIVNSNPNRKAHPIQGAAFLAHFVKEGTAWAHIDVAGVHVEDAGRNAYAKDTPTGFGARLLAELLRTL